MDTSKNMVSCAFSLVKLCIFKCIYQNRINFHIIERFSPNTTIKLGKNCKLDIGNKVRAHSGTKIQVRDNAIVKLGDNVAFNYNCILTAKKEIVIGDGCEIGPNVLFYDHDHNVKTHPIKDKEYFKESIIVGKNVWIGANAIILKGAHIGDGCVIGAGTIVTKGKYENYSLIKTDRKVSVIASYAFNAEERGTKW